MQIPYVIDNIEQRLADVLRYLLSRASDQSLDIATAYFSIRGFEQVRHELETTGQVRLLLGDKPLAGDDLGMRPDSGAFLRHELNAEAFSERTLRLVEALIRFLRRDKVDVRLYTGFLPDEQGRRAFLHAKCYLLYGRLPDANVFDPLTPIVGIVGSSNFTGPGLVSNHELNLVHKTLLTDAELDDAEAKATVAQHAAQQTSGEPDLEQERLLKSEIGTRAILDLSRWYEQQWQRSIDYKDQLIELLENSKFGGREYTPYEIYMKALYRYFKDDLAERDEQPATRSAVELAEFQDDAVRKARRILAQYDGVIVADSVGLGKTWIGKKLLEDYAYHQRQKALVICPASLRGMWERELRSATIAGQVLTQERLGLDEFDSREFLDVDVILVDEAHNFRNKRAKRYQQLELLLAANGRRGRSGNRKKLIMLTATPINNNIFDLYNQINLFTGNDRSYFASAGIGDLYKYFLAARRESMEAGSIRIFNLLEEVVIRRTRQFIRLAYPEALIHGEPIRWPTRQLHSVEYDLQAAYSGLYQNIIRAIEGLHLAHYNLEAYKLRPIDQDEFELGRQAALVGIFKSRFLKRLESSIEAFRISIRRSLAFVKTFAEYVQDGVVLDSVSFQQAMRLLEADDEDSDDSTPSSQASAIDEHAAASAIIAKLPKLEASKYDRRRLHRALQADIDALNDIWHAIRQIQASHDAKLVQLQALLANQLNGCKVVIFTYYKDTARYLYQTLTDPSNAAWQASLGNPTIRRIDSSIKTSDRAKIVSHFAPRASNQPDLIGTSEEVQILIATDVLSEGHNLQDCGHLLNYDLHWNPTRMVQRAGRIDRLGSNFDVLHVYNMFPERELEALLGLVRSLTSKIDLINQTGFLDASVLGEVVTPRDFNTLKRIADEDNAVVEEQESFLELASSESLFAELQNVLATDAQRWLTDLDDGIHSGIERSNAKGLFFYFTAPRDGSTAHFWRYYDLAKQTITDNRYTIMQLIACSPDTPRFPPPYSEVDIFAIHDTILNSILRDVQQQVTATVVDKIVAPEQNVIAQLLHNHLAQPGVDRSEVRELRKMLKEPQVGAVVQRLRKALNRYNADADVQAVLELLRELYQTQGRSTLEPTSPASTIKRDDLTLVCYEYVYA